MGERRARIEWLRWLGLDRKRPGIDDAVPRASSSVVAPTVQLPLELGELPSAWQADEKRLLLVPLRPIGRGERVTVEIHAPGAAVVPVTGTTVGIVNHLGVTRVEIAVDPERRAVIRRLLAASAGGPGGLTPRPPRYAVRLPVVVASDSKVKTSMTTVSLSAGGCALLWSGPPPLLGSHLPVQLGSAPQSVAYLTRVRWVRRQGAGYAVGLHFVAGQRSRLTALLAEVARGATPS